MTDDPEEAWTLLVDHGLSTNQHAENGAEIAVQSGWSPADIY